MSPMISTGTMAQGRGSPFGWEVIIIHS
jgi:hypothetical protein